MALIPRTAPMISNPRAAYRLGERWHRARSLLLVSCVALPSALGLVCIAFAAMAGFVSGWSLIPVLAALACTVALVLWLRGDGLTDPQSWFPATVLMVGSELVLGVIPGFGIAGRYATGIAAKAVLTLSVLGAGAACVTARLARRSLVGSPIPELGSTDFRLVLNDGSTRLVVGHDRVEWTTRRGGVRFDAAVRFTQLRKISLHSSRVDAVSLDTSTGRWTMPVSDAALICDLLQQRKALWDNRVEAAIERERELYQDMMRVLDTATATARTADNAIAVTVNANGGPTHIKLTERVLDRDPDLVSEQIMACIRQGHSAVRQHVRRLTVDAFTEADQPRRDVEDDLLVG